MLPPASAEQQAIIAASIAQGDNVIAQAVAGAGKSTTCFHIVQAKQGKCVLLCFNVGLQTESEKRAKALGLDGKVDCFTVHGLATLTFGRIVPDLYTLQTVVKSVVDGDSDVVPAREYNYDLCFIDEAQDMSVDMVNMICAFYNLNLNKQMQFVVVGDSAQEIYSYSRSRPVDLLQNPQKWLPDNGRKWRNLGLLTSYRLTPPVCAFVNTLFSDVVRNAIVAGNTTSKHVRPQYVIGDAGSGHLRQLVRTLLDTYKVDDIMILTPSVENNYVCQKLCLQLAADHGIAVFCSSQSDVGNYEELVKNKLVLSSFHKSKGLERRVVLIVGVGAYYQDRWASEPNPLHVALTRARERLIIFQQFNDGRLSPFRDNDKLREVADVQLLTHETLYTARKPPPKKPLTSGTWMADSLTKFVSEDCVEHLKTAIKISRPKNMGPSVSCGARKMFNGESVWPLYEPAICAAFEYMRTGKADALTKLDKTRQIHTLPGYCKALIQQIVTRGSSPINTVEWITVALAVRAMDSGNMHVPHQLKSVGWIKQTECLFFEQCMHNLLSLTSRHTKYAFNQESSRIISRKDALGNDVVMTVKATAPYLTTDPNTGAIIPWITSLDDFILEAHMWKAVLLLWVFHATAVNVFFVTKNEVVQIRPTGQAELDSLILKLLARK